MEKPIAVPPRFRRKAAAPEPRQWPYETDLPDGLFDLKPRVCADCGESFRTSQPAERCALCASLRSGPVGAATVQCPVCGVEHEVPVLAPHKVCGICALDPVLARANIDSDLEAAHIRAGEAKDWLANALAEAHIDDRTRYAAVVEARKSGIFHGKHYTPAQLAAGWAKAMAAGDGLARLLAADDAQRAAEAALAQALNDGQVALAEIAKVRS